MGSNEHESFFNLIKMMEKQVEEYENFIPEEEIKVLMCEVGKEPYVTYIKPKCEEFRKIVEGDWEVASIGHGVMSIQHGTAKFEKKPNRPVGGDYYFGNFFFCGIKLSHEISLTDFQIKELKSWLENVIVCPFCGEKYEDRPARSRLIDGLKICPECGLKEALFDAGISDFPIQKFMRHVIASRRANGIE